MKLEYVHFYVEDATKMGHWFVHQLGFQAVGSRTSQDRRTEIVTSGEICFVLSSALTVDSPVAEFLRSHPPGVVDVAFRVPDVAILMAKAKSHGARILEPIQKQESLKWGKIAAWGSLSHTLIEGIGHGSSILADRKISPSEKPSPATLTSIDHVVLNVTTGDLEKTVTWYQEIFGFKRQQTFDIQTERSGLHSQVMLHPSGSVQLPINESASANSQIQEFLDFNRGPGIQHIALQTKNLVQATPRLRAAGIAFLSVPPTYYSELRQRPGLPLTVTELAEIAQQQILVDWQEEALAGGEQVPPLLLQIFTQPIFPQPTFFFELIERRVGHILGQQRQAQGFGEGNFRALFEAIEREQIQRGFHIASSKKLPGNPS